MGGRKGWLGRQRGSASITAWGEEVINHPPPKLEMGVGGGS